MKKIIPMIVTILLLAACNAVSPTSNAPDLNVIRTEAVSTFVAGMPVEPVLSEPTQAPTATPEPTNTTAVEPTAIALPTIMPSITKAPVVAKTYAPVIVTGDHGYLVSQSPADWAKIAPGDGESVFFTIMNNGTTTWTEDYTFRYIDGYQAWGVTQISLPDKVKPGETVFLGINVFPPEDPGNYYTTYWGLFNADGTQFLQVYFTFVVER